MQRARTLKTLKQVRSVGRGKNVQKAVIKVTSRKVQQKAKGKPFLLGQDKKTMARILRKFTPTKMNYFHLLLRRMYRKTFNKKSIVLSEHLFGVNSNLGILVVRPELFDQANKIKHLLKNRGMGTLFSKAFTFDKTAFLEVYPQAFQYTKQFPEFTPFAANNINGINRVLVFKWNKDMPARKKEGALNDIKNQIRTFVALPFLKQLGYTGRQLNNFGKELDSLGFVEATNANEKSVLNVFNGVHMPNANTMAKDALVFLSSKELQLISNQLR